jgi:hypothetical protein
MPVVSCYLQGDLEKGKKYLSDGEHIADTAVLYLNQIIVALEKKTLGERELKIADACFMGGDLATVLEKLQQTRDGIRDTKIKLKLGSVFPNVNRSIKDVIELSWSVFKSPVQSIRYFIHEASHLYANTADFGTDGYIDKADEEGSTGKFRGSMDQKKAMNNADSYACFVTLCYGDKLF